jgi:hypothetical protein
MLCERVLTVSFGLRDYFCGSRNCFSFSLNRPRSKTELGVQINERFQTKVPKSIISVKDKVPHCCMKNYNGDSIYFISQKYRFEQNESSRLLRRLLCLSTTVISEASEHLSKPRPHVPVLCACALSSASNGAARRRVSEARVIIHNCARGESTFDLPMRRLRTDIQTFSIAS